MRTAAISGSVIALASHVAFADVVRHATVPEPLWGKWATSSETCDKADNTVIVLSAKSYVSSKATCTVEWLSETAGAHGPLYSAHLRCSDTPNGGQATIMNIVFLPQDANRLSIGADFSKLKIYQRCSAGAPAVAR